MVLLAPASIGKQCANTRAELFDADLARRGISVDVARYAGMFSVTNMRAESPFSEAPPVAATVIPYFNADGDECVFHRDGRQLPFCRARLLEPEPQTFVKRKSRRYWQPPGSGVRAYFPRVNGTDWRRILADSAQPLLITEGEFKAFSCAHNGFPCIGLGGVWNAYSKEGHLLPDLETIARAGRDVYIVFDADAATKSDVRYAERRLAKALATCGAKVHIVRLPADGPKGVDDFVQKNGPQALQALLDATPEAEADVHISEGSDVELADALLARLADQHCSSIVHCEGAFYVYADTHWRALERDEIVKAVCSFDGANCGKRGKIKINEMRIKSITAIARAKAGVEKFFTDAPAGINCASGFISFCDDGTPVLEPHRPELRQRHCLPGCWSLDATWCDSPLLRKLLEGCFQGEADWTERLCVIQEALGSAALGIGARLKEPKAVVLFGPGAENGKSQILELARGLLPPSAVRSLPPVRFGDERMLKDLIGCKLNACAELGTSHTITSDAFKAVVTGDQVVAKGIYRDPVYFEPSAQHIFATNTLPPFQGGFDRGVQRRLLVIPFNRVIPKEQRVADIGKRIAAEEAGALLSFAVDGASRLIRAGRFTELPSGRKALFDWVFGADPVLAWYDNRAAYCEGERTWTREAYEDFKRFAEGSGFRSDRLPTSNNFAQRLKAQDGRIGSGRVNTGRYFLANLKLLSGPSW